jgi:hypothetical protein
MGRSWKHKPWKVLPGLLLITLGLPLVGMDLLDGDITIRRLGHLTADGTPGRFALVWAICLIAVPLTAIGWRLFVNEWRADHRPRLKPEFDDPEKRRRL